MNACLNDSCVVEHHQSSLRQVLRQVVENIITHFAMIVDEKFRVVTFLQREFGDTLVGQIIIEIRNMYVFCIHCLLLIAVLLILELYF